MPTDVLLRTPVGMGSQGYQRPKQASILPGPDPTTLLNSL